MTALALSQKTQVLPRRYPRAFLVCVAVACRVVKNSRCGSGSWFGCLRRPKMEFGVVLGPDLQHQNVRKYGTVFNPVAPGTELSDVLRRKLSTP